MPGSDISNLENNLKLTLNKHMTWLNEIGMVGNSSKTEIMILGSEQSIIEIGNTPIETLNKLKVLGTIVDSELKWDINTEKIVSRCRSFLYGLRYLRRTLNLEDMARLLKAQVISVITYCAPVWFHRLSYRSRMRLRSIYFHIIRVIVRDFDYKLNRRGLLRAMKMEDLDTIMNKRTSCFVFKILYHLQPTNLTGIFLSKCYSNARTPEKLAFFDTSRGLIGRACLSNGLRKIVSEWDFPWLNLEPNIFKQQLAAQLSNSVND